MFKKWFTTVRAAARAMPRGCRSGLALAIGVAAAGTAAANVSSVTFSSLGDRFGLNYELSFAGSLINVELRATQWYPLDSNLVQVQLFDGSDGTGSLVFDGSLDTLMTKTFTDAGLLDGSFSTVLSYTGGSLPSNPYAPNSVFMQARGKQDDFVRTYWTTPSTSFAPAAAVPEPDTSALLLAGTGVIAAVARRRAARREQPASHQVA